MPTNSGKLATKKPTACTASGKWRIGRAVGVHLTRHNSTLAFFLQKASGFA